MEDLGEEHSSPTEATANAKALRHGMFKEQKIRVECDKMA